MTALPSPVRMGDVLISSAVVRLDKHPDGTPNIYLHEDSAHACIGVSDAYIDGHNLMIISSKPGPVISALAYPDESLGGKYGIIMGISGGGPGSRVWFWDTRIGRRLLIDNPADYDRIAGANSNIWFEIKHYAPLGPEPSASCCCGGQ